MRRCDWAKTDLAIRYHDEEWGMPVHDDRRWFEFLVLEGAQAGLSWDTILRRRENYLIAFDQFDPSAVARYDERKLEALLADPGIIRNRLKVTSAVRNAQAFLRIQEEFGSFDSYIWRFVGGFPIKNSWSSPSEVPVRTERART
jgi:DNA-3-methyladenine glycosylase I